MPLSFAPTPLVPSETHKLLRQVAEGPPARSPVRFHVTGRYLVIVNRDHRDLYNYLKTVFADEPGVQVIQDRCTAERRGKSSKPSLDRRCRDRRKRRSARRRLESLVSQSFAPSDRTPTTALPTFAASVRRVRRPRDADQELPLRRIQRVGEVFQVVRAGRRGCRGSVRPVVAPCTQDAHAMHAESQLSAMQAPPGPTTQKA
jgi:hypothetical protein